MKKNIGFIIILVCAILAILLAVYVTAKNNLSIGPGNIKYIYAQVTQINDSSSCNAIVTKENTEFDIGNTISVLNIDSYYERINNEIVEINDLAVGDTIMIMYFESENDTITSVRAIERINSEDGSLC